MALLQLLLSLATVFATAQSATQRRTAGALVEIVGGSDASVYGKLSLYEEGHGVYIEGLVRNLTPGLHGFHVHEKGQLGNLCKDAGGHFNPDKKKHAGPTDTHRHAGDLGNIYADDNGIAKISLFDGHISLDPSSRRFIGSRSFVVHAKADDLGRGGNEESLKTGNAGSRVGCGTVVVLSSGVPHTPAGSLSARPHSRPSSVSSGSNRPTAFGSSHFRLSAPTRPKPNTHVASNQFSQRIFGSPSPSSHHFGGSSYSSGSHHGSFAPFTQHSEYDSDNFESLGSASTHHGGYASHGLHGGMGSYGHSVGLHQMPSYGTHGYGSHNAGPYHYPAPGIHGMGDNDFDDISSSYMSSGYHSGYGHGHGHGGYW